MVFKAGRSVVRATARDPVFAESESEDSVSLVGARFLSFLNFLKGEQNLSLPLRGLLRGSSVPLVSLVTTRSRVSLPLQLAAPGFWVSSALPDVYEIYVEQTDRTVCEHKPSVTSHRDGEVRRLMGHLYIDTFQLREVCGIDHLWYWIRRRLYLEGANASWFP